MHPLRSIRGNLSRTAIYLVLMALLVSCANEEPVVTPAASPTATVTPASPGATATPRPSPTVSASPTPTAEPTPILPAISVSDQALTETGRLLIDSVTAAEPGWLVIHAQRDGQVGEVLGFAPVRVGLNDDLTLTIDPLQATAALVAMLHIDANEPDKFEFPGPDAPLQNGSDVLATSFAVELDFTLPSITVSDQDVTEDGLVLVENVYSPQDGWLFIHANREGAIGAKLGFAFVSKGVNENLVVPIRWREGTPRLYAMLYEDAGRSRRLDEEQDLPLLVSGEPVVAPFNATFPPDVFVLDQPVVNGEVVIERVVSNGPAWLVLYNDDNGDIGRIVGFAPLVEGVNEQVTVAVVEAAVTPLLHILAHEDTEPGDDFGYPAVDRPLTYEGRRPPPFTFRTNAGNYLVTRDQSLGEDSDTGSPTVTIPLVVVDAPTWINVQNDQEGEAGDTIGLTWIPAGVNRDVIVEVDVEGITDVLYATLHLDRGVVEEFEYPDGPDIPLQRGRSTIRSPFTLLAESGS